MTTHRTTPRNRAGSLLFLVVLLLGVLPARSGAQQQAGAATQVTVEGLGAIIAGDRAKAEEDAVTDALRNAVSQVMGTHVESQTLVENFQLVQDRIMTRTRGYISTYQVMSKSDEEDLIRVRVTAVVKESDLVGDLEAIGLLLARKNYPRLLVLVDETIFVDEGNEERAPTSVDAANTTIKFMEMLQPHGFRFVEPSIVAARTEANVLSSAISGDMAQAARIGRANQADVVVLGRTVVKRGSVQVGGGLTSMQASVTMQVVRADTGELITQGLQTEAGIGAGPVDGAQRAVVRALDKLAPQIETQILAKWSEEVTSGTILELTITNTISFSDLQKFIQLLPFYVRGVESVTMRSFSEGLAVLEVRSENDAMSMAGEFSAKKWEEFTVEVVGVTANQVRVKVTPPGGGDDPRIG